MKHLCIFSYVLISMWILPLSLNGQWEGYEVVMTTDPLGVGTVTLGSRADCPSGKIAVNGGYGVDDPGEELVVVTNAPLHRISGSSGWISVVKRTGSTATNLHVFAICVNATQGATPSAIIPSLPDSTPGGISGEVSAPSFVISPGGAPTTDTFVRAGYGGSNGRAYGFNNPNNLAESGQPAVAKDVISGYAAIHDAAFLNDGRYGNGSSWIGITDNTWIKIDLGSVVSFNRIRFGRDRTGGFADRPPGRFVISVADSDIFADGDDSYDENEYKVVAYSSTMGFDGTIPKGQSVVVAFPTVNARFLKVVFGSGGVAIDEVEVYLRN